VTWELPWLRVAAGGASGRFLLRPPPGLRAALRVAAAAARLSRNDYCVRRLATPGGHPATFAGAAQTVQRAAGLLGEGLLGIVAFGSWARSEAVAGSDLDVLVVIAPDVALTRALYRAWDETPVAWDGRNVEPHFVHLPEPEDPVTDIWAEVAVDGLVLHECGWRVSRYLARVRRNIAEGRLVRRTAHGQPYWTRVA
jgi:predicted nucleotidyltransferase